MENETTKTRGKTMTLPKVSLNCLNNQTTKTRGKTMTLPKEVLLALENHPKANEKFVGTFTTYQEVVDYFPDWWEEEYEHWSVQEIVHSWAESCCLHIIPHHGELYVFGDLDY